MFNVIANLKCVVGLIDLHIRQYRQHRAPVAVAQRDIHASQDLAPTQTDVAQIARFVDQRQRASAQRYLLWWRRILAVIQYMLGQCSRGHCSAPLY